MDVEGHHDQKWPDLPNLNALEERAPITTTFKDGLNNMGVYQHKSTLTGQDATGVNDGSKNSTLMNYLPDAWNHGAEMYFLFQPN